VPGRAERTSLLQQSIKGPLGVIDMSDFIVQIFSVMQFEQE